MKKTITLFFLLAAFFAKAQTTLNLKFFIQGYYQGGGVTRTDTAVVVLRNSSDCLVAETFKGVFMSDGTMTCNFSSSIAGNSYWISVIHRTAIQTTNSSPVLFSAVTNYDFSDLASKAYGNNMMQVDFSPDVWAFYNGDINQDQNVDLLDFPSMDNGIMTGACGYVKGDLNNDRNVDLIDFPILDLNINQGTFGWPFPPCRPKPDGHNSKNF